MPKYTPKKSRERAERFQNSWQENAADKEFAETSLTEFKAKRAAVAAKEDEIEASRAHTKNLEIQRDNLNSELMKDCDFIAADVEGDRNFGSDSALYGGFGYIRESEKKRGGRKATTPAPTP
jgi:uncharacterized protein YbaA (DUF1428 family)